MSLSLYLCILLFTVSTSEANYEFTVHFYEFCNPLGLQCGECESGGPPACCDDVQRNENCSMSRPFTCDTRLRFLLRPFGASVETALTTGYPYFTPSNGGNSEVFNEGPGGLLGLQNPFTITTTDGWTGRVQFHVDAVDRAVGTSGVSETLAIINRFPINLEMTLRANTKRTTYTGIYNISGVGFDMSFRAQCSANYYGPNCTTLCESMERVYTCDSEGRAVCLQSNYDPTTNCTLCLPQYDLTTNCTLCLPQYDLTTNCTTCLDRPDLNPSTNCKECIKHGHDPASNCTVCLPNFIHTTGNTCVISATEDDGLNRPLVGGAVGGAVVIIMAIILCSVVGIVLKRKKKTKYDMSDAASCHSVAGSSTYTRKMNTASGCSSTLLHDLDNLIYEPSRTSANAEKYPLDQLLEVPNPFYNEFCDPSDVGSNRSSQTSLGQSAPRQRLDTFPYVMDGDCKTNPSTPYHQCERVKHVVYELADMVTGKSMIAGRGAKKETAGTEQCHEKCDDIKICAGLATVYDDIETCKKSADAKPSSTLALYDDITTLTLYDDIKIPAEGSVSCKMKESSSFAEYDDIKESGIVLSEAAAKANNGDTFTHSNPAEQPFDDELYNVPFSPPSHQPFGASFMAIREKIPTTMYMNTNSQIN